MPSETTHFDDLFRRDGHATDLTLERLVFEDLGEDEAAAVYGHIDSCSPCTERLTEIQNDEASAEHLPMPAELAARLAGSSPAPAPVEPSRAAEAEPELAKVIPLRRRWMAGAAVLAAAAAVLFVYRPQVPPTTDPDDGIRLRGSGVGLEVYLDDGDGGKRLNDQATIAAGDRVGFRYKVAERGYLLIAGTDAGGSHYPCSPASGRAVAVEPTKAFVPAEDAVRFDDTPGTETITAIYCKEPFTLADLPAGAAVPDGCSSERVRLEKRAP